MKLLHKHLLASVMTVAFLSPVMADESHHVNCDDKAMVDVENMGMVNEAAIQKHLNKLQEQMKRVRHARGSHVSKKRELKQHVADMQEAMEELHKQMYASGCKDAKHGAPIETRVEVMEKRMNAMQEMMKHMVDNMSEQESK